MSTTKVFLCDFCVIVVLGLTCIIAEDTPKVAPVDEGPKGNCSCGGFPTPTPAVNVEPLLARAPGLVVKCDEEGENTCKSLCIALATATKAKGPEILCNKLKDADELKLSAFYQVCDKPWTYANMTADEALCCSNSKAKICASSEISNSTVPLDAKPAV